MCLNSFSIRSLLLFCLLSCMADAMIAQDTLVVAFGTVKELVSEEAVKDVQVDAIDQKWGMRVMGRTNGAGRYQLDFVHEAEYIIEFSAPGYVSKRVRINMHGPTAEDWAGGFGMEMDITLMRELPDIDYAIFDEPVGISNYDTSAGNFTWDLAYMERMRERAQRTLEAYKQKRAATAR